MLSRLTLICSLCALPGCTAPSAEPRPLVVQAVERVADDPTGLAVPNALTSVKFAVIGDSGRGDDPQHQVAAQMVRLRESFRYPFVVMLGDNIYEGPATAEDYRKKFEEPYQTLLRDKVRFYAVLGNHDDPKQVSYPLFNMGGQRYYSFAPPEDLIAKATTRVEFFAIDSTNLDRVQLRWLEERLATSKAQWKICLLHHPLYTSGRYRSTARAHRWTLEPIFVRHGVQVVFSGHEHIYQRTQLQKGVQYFVSGGAGSLRLDDSVPAPYVARSFDQDYHFMLVEIDGDELHFQAIARSGRTVDAGTLFLDAEEARRAANALREADTAAPR
jgi:predicted phosphodiesterase